MCVCVRMHVHACVCVCVCVCTCVCTYIHVMYHMFECFLSVMIEAAPLNFCYRYQYDSSKLQELISELDQISFEMDSRKKSKRGKVSLPLLVTFVRFTCIVLFSSTLYM